MAADRSSAVRVSVRVFVLSRAWMFLCAVLGFVLAGADRSNVGRFGGPPFAHPFDGLAAKLVGVWGRWDSVWYLSIAHDGYAQAVDRPGFFPLFPLSSRGLAEVGSFFSPSPGLLFVCAIIVSLACFGLALYLLHRLCALEIGANAANLTVLLLAFFPMAVFYGAIYSESVFLLASVAAVWFARCDRWALAGACGAAAAASRSVGVALVVPLVLLYLLGPRGRGEGTLPYLGAPRLLSRSTWRKAGPRRLYPLRPDALWILLVPVGLAAYMLYLWIAEGDPFRFGSAQLLWGHSFGHFGPLPAGPLAGAWDGAVAAGRGIRDILKGANTTLWAPDGGRSLTAAGINVEAFVFTLFAAWAAVGALRRLPLAYGAYAVVMIALALTYPVTHPGYDVPLFSLPRYVAVVFPLFMWMALALEGRAGPRRLVLGGSAALAGLYAAQFGTWQWVS